MASRISLLVLTVFLCTLPVHADLTTDLIGKWSFDLNGSDASGLGNHATYKGTASNAVGTNRKALACSTNGSYADIGNGTNTIVSSKLTVAAWVYHQGGLSSGGRHTILSRYQTSASGFIFDLIDAAEYVRFQINNTSVYTTVYSTPANQWVHLAATFDGTTMCIYTNGYLLYTSIIPAQNITNSGNLLIGARADSGPGNFMNGRIDEAYMYGRVLTASEILDLRNYSAFPIVYTNILMYGKVSTSLGAPLAGVLAWVSNAVGTTAGAWSRNDGTFTLEVEQFTNVTVTLTPPAGARIPVTATNFTTPATNFAMDFSVVGSADTTQFKAPAFYSPFGGDLQLQVFKTNEASERVVVSFIPVAANARFRMADTTLSGKVNLLTLNASAISKILTTGTYIMEMKIVPEGRIEDDARNFVQRKILVLGR